MDKSDPFFSLIIPVYNRPEEMQELLESATLQSLQDFELIIIEDGSGISSENIVNQYVNKLSIKYVYKDNSGPSDSRNQGMNLANGKYFIILDSDVILPINYLKVIYESLTKEDVDYFGGADSAMDEFSGIQKAINFSMTSILTTGGIRGAKTTKKFHPRSFNLGMKADVFRKTRGFNTRLRFGEDIDLSIRVLEAGFKVKYIHEAFVYHKRRTNFKLFFKQIFNFGLARINLSKIHPGTLKFIHFLPLGYVLFWLISWVIYGITKYPLGLELWGFVNFFILIEALIKLGYKNAILGLISANIQLFAYGLGFASGIYFYLFDRKKLTGFEKNLYQ